MSSPRCDWRSRLGPLCRVSNLCSRCYSQILAERGDRSGNGCERFHVPHVRETTGVGVPFTQGRRWPSSPATHARVGSGLGLRLGTRLPTSSADPPSSEPVRTVRPRVARTFDCPIVVDEAQAEVALGVAPGEKPLARAHVQRRGAEAGQRSPFAVHQRDVAHCLAQGGQPRAMVRSQRLIEAPALLTSARIGRTTRSWSAVEAIPMPLHASAVLLQS